MIIPPDYESHRLELSATALDVFINFQREIEVQLPDFGVLGDLPDWGSKLAGAVARIAGNLHVAEHVNEPAPWDIQISEATMRRAIELGRYFVSHAIAANAEMGADPTIEDAKHILKWLTVKGTTSISGRDLLQGVKGKFKSMDRLSEPLRLLIQHGYIRKRIVEVKNGHGRPPSPLYDVNPWIHAHKPHNSQNTPAQPNSEDIEDNEYGLDIPFEENQSDEDPEDTEADRL